MQTFNFGQYPPTLQTDKQDRQAGQDRQRSGGIGRTVLQTVAQKPHVQTLKKFSVRVIRGRGSVVL